MFIDYFRKSIETMTFYKYVNINFSFVIFQDRVDRSKYIVQKDLLNISIRIYR